MTEKIFIKISYKTHMHVVRCIFQTAIALRHVMVVMNVSHEVRLCCVYVEIFYYWHFIIK